MGGWSMIPHPSSRFRSIPRDSARSYTILGDSGRFWEISAIHSPRLPNALDKEPEVFALLAEAHRPLATREIGDQLPVRASRATLLDDLGVLRDQGLVALTGRGRSARWRLE